MESEREGADSKQTCAAKKGKSEYDSSRDPCKHVNEQSHLAICLTKHRRVLAVTGRTTILATASYSIVLHMGC